VVQKLRLSSLKCDFRTLQIQRDRGSELDLFRIVSPPCILNFQKFIFGHKTVIEFRISVVYQIPSKSDDFYRATRMHSADYAVARCLSVCPSVCHTPVSCLNGYTYPQHFLPSGTPTVLVFPYQTSWQNSSGDPLMGASNARGVKKSRFSTNISLYLANNARWSHSYYGRQIGNRTQAFE